MVTDADPVWKIRAEPRKSPMIASLALALLVTTTGLPYRRRFSASVAAGALSFDANVVVRLDVILLQLGDGRSHAGQIEGAGAAEVDGCGQVGDDVSIEYLAEPVAQLLVEEMAQVRRVLEQVAGDCLGDVRERLHRVVDPLQGSSHATPQRPRS